MDKIVFVIDDDESVCRSLRRVMKSEGFHVRTFTSAEEFLNQGCPTLPGCLILDVRMPGMGGLELQRKLVELSPPMPVIFMSAHDDVLAREQGLAAGAVAFLKKPFESQVLLEAVRSALSGITDE